MIKSSMDQTTSLSGRLQREIPADRDDGEKGLWVEDQNEKNYTNKL